MIISKNLVQTVFELKQTLYFELSNWIVASYSGISLRQRDTENKINLHPSEKVSVFKSSALFHVPYSGFLFERATA